MNNLLAIDIFNEPWDYTWAEWKRLAEKAFEVIDAPNQDVLIMVEDVGSAKADGTQVPHGDPDSNPNWGENFYGAQTDPLNIPKERLIISPHTYGPSVFVQRQFMDPSQPLVPGWKATRPGMPNATSSSMQPNSGRGGKNISASSGTRAMPF